MVCCMAFNPRRGNLPGGEKRGKCGQAEMDDYDGGAPTVTGDGSVAQQLPFEYLS